MDLYPWVKSAHIVSVIAWMAAMLYLPRLFVYHADCEAGSERSETFKVMERRLYRAIGTPAMLASWVFGLWLVFGWVGWQPGWLHGKLMLVLALSAFHGAMGAWLRAFAEDRNTRSARYFRIFNEVPALIMVGVVILVVVKPF